nr:MAG TPA: hypothetical protein [Caudoviricetes sp.]
MAGSSPRRLARSQWPRRMETPDRRPLPVSPKRQKRSPRDA